MNVQQDIFKRGMTQGMHNPLLLIIYLLYRAPVAASPPTCTELIKVILSFKFRPQCSEQGTSVKTTTTYNL